MMFEDEDEENVTIGRAWHR